MDTSLSSLVLILVLALVLSLSSSSSSSCHRHCHCHCPCHLTVPPIVVVDRHCHCPHPCPCHRHCHSLVGCCVIGGIDTSLSSLILILVLVLVLVSSLSSSSSSSSSCHRHHHHPCHLHRLVGCCVILDLALERSFAVFVQQSSLDFAQGVKSADAVACPLLCVMPHVKKSVELLIESVKILVNPNA